MRICTILIHVCSCLFIQFKTVRLESKRDQRWKLRILGIMPGQFSQFDIDVDTENWRWRAYATWCSWMDASIEIRNKMPLLLLFRFKLLPDFWKIAVKRGVINKNMNYWRRNWWRTLPNLRGESFKRPKTSGKRDYLYFARGQFFDFDLRSELHDFCCICANFRTDENVHHFSFWRYWNVDEPFESF